MKDNLPERRRFTRIDVPLKIVVKSPSGEGEALTRNISPVGLKFETKSKLEESEPLALSIYLPHSNVPIRINGKVVWQNKVSLEDKSPYNVGFEILDIEDKDKNIFLKYLCDLFYESNYETRV